MNKDHEKRKHFSFNQRNLNEIVVRFDFLFDYNARQIKIFVDDKFDKIHSFRHFR